jgi:hypothetical protein
VAEGLARAGFDIDLREGQAREDALVHVFLKDKVEHKADHWAAKTGNVAIEYRQHGRPSGIATTEAHYYALELVGLGWFIIETDRLKALARLAIRERRTKRIGDNNAYDNALVPVEWLVRPWKGATA